MKGEKGEKGMIGLGKVTGKGLKLLLLNSRLTLNTRIFFILL